MSGQSYTVALAMDAPESDVNRKLGMFLTCLALKSPNTEIVAESCRSAILTYRSELLRAIETVIMSPFLVTGLYKGAERQSLYVEFFPDFVDDPLDPATNIDVHIMSRHVELYSLEYRVYANFSGIRRLMFDYPVVSFVLGTGFNFGFLMTVAFVSWYR